MAFKKVEKGPEEVGRYWNPEEVGEEITGHIYKFVTDDWGNLRIDLYLGESETGEALLCMLPAHADLKRFYVNLERGDYINVKVVKVIPPRKEGGHPKRLYEVLVDDTKQVEWPDDEADSEYEAEIVE